VGVVGARLVDAGDRLAQLHQASTNFDTTGAIWQIPVHKPAEVICLNDVAPYNMVFDDDHQLRGLIDIDTASPGPRVWDLGYMAYRLVPLTQLEDTGAGVLSMAARRHRLRQLCRSYASAGKQTDVSARDVLHTIITRLEDLAAFTARRAAAGADHVAGHVQPYLADARWIGQHLDDL
jgi:aminoglycoside phosphotransferase (APT) family kinase protein